MEDKNLIECVVTLRYGRQLFDVELTSSSLEAAKRRATIMFCVSRRIPLGKTDRVEIYDAVVKGAQ